MAAALLAALFALGVFAPAGVEAGVRGGSEEPDFTMSSNIPEKEGVTMTVEFTVGDPVDGTANNVFIVVPADVATNLTPAVYPAGTDKITLMQGTNSVGKVSVEASPPGTVKIEAHATDQTKNVQAGVRTTLEITGLTLGTGTGGDVLMVQDRAAPANADAADHVETVNLHRSVLHSPAPTVDLKLGNEADDDAGVLAVADELTLKFSVDSTVSAVDSVTITIAGYTIAANAAGTATDEAGTAIPGANITFSGSVITVASLTPLTATETSKRFIVKISNDAAAVNTGTLRVKATFQHDEQPLEGAPVAYDYLTAADEPDNAVGVPEAGLLSNNDAEAKAVTMTFSFTAIDSVEDDASKVKVELSDDFTEFSMENVSVQKDVDGTATDVGGTESADGNAFNIVKHASDATKNVLADDEIMVTITGLTNPVEPGSQSLVTVTQGGYSRASVSETIGPAPIPPEDREVKLSSDVAGDAVQVTVRATAGANITSATDITIDLKKFGVPSAISESSVNIADDDGGDMDSRRYVGEPNSVTVNGTKITLALYSRFPGSENDAGIIDGGYTVTIKQSAGITNPITAGKATVTVKDADGTDETFKPDIKSKVKLSAGEGPRGTAVTVSGVGLGKGGATVFLVQGICPDQGSHPGRVAELEDLQEDDPDATADDLPYATGTDCPEDDEEDISLGNGTVSGGKVSVDIDTSSTDFRRGNMPVDKKGNHVVEEEDVGAGNYVLVDGSFDFEQRSPDEPYLPSDVNRGLNHITIVDGSGKNADKPAYFTITPTVMPDDDSVQQGDELTILVEDWYYGSLNNATITIGDEVAPGGAYDIDVSEGDGEFKIQVPNSARLGDQELKVTGTSTDDQGSLPALGADAAKGRVIVGALDIEVEPATVVLGQQFTISISGFIDDPRPSAHPAGQDIVEVKVGDIVMEDTTGGETIDELTIDTNGDFTNTFEVDPTDEYARLLKPGTYRIRVEDWSGRVAIGHITYPEPEITVDPPVSRRGTTVTLTGENFPAGRVVHVYYDDDDEEENLLGAVLADSAGNVRMNFTVPSNAEIGDEQDIIAKSQANEFQYKAKGTHALPEQELIVTPSSVSAGGRVRIEGHNMPLFTLVTLEIANINLSGKGVETDGLGSFVIENVLMPQLKPGTHTVEAQVATQGDDDAKVRAVIQIVDVVTRDSEEAFADLIDNGTLTRVWHLDRETQTWSFFDPAPEFADFNTLEQVSSGQIVTIIMSAQDTFQGKTLFVGSNPTSIE